MNGFQSKVIEEFGTIHQTLASKVSTLVVQEIKANFEINGAFNVTMNDLNTLSARLVSSFTSELEKIRGVLTHQNNPTNSAVVVLEDDYLSLEAGKAPSWWGEWNWKDGKLAHPVPLGWRFPSRLSLKRIWDLWHFGHRAEKLRPLKFLSRKHDAAVESDKKLYSTVSKLVAEFEKFIVNHNPRVLPDGIDQIRKLSYIQNDIVTAKVYLEFIQYLYETANSGNFNREDDVSYGTLYNKLLEVEKKLSI